MNEARDFKPESEDKPQRSCADVYKRQSFLLEPQLYTPHLSFTLDGRWNKGSVDRPVQEVE